MLFGKSPDSINNNEENEKKENKNECITP